MSKWNDLTKRFDELATQYPLETGIGSAVVGTVGYRTMLDGIKLKKRASDHPHLRVASKLMTASGKSVIFLSAMSIAYIAFDKINII